MARRLTDTQRSQRMLRDWLCWEHGTLANCLLRRTPTVEELRHHVQKLFEAGLDRFVEEALAETAKQKAADEAVARKVVKFPVREIDTSPPEQPA